MKNFEFSLTQLTLPKVFTYVLFIGIAFHFFTFFLKDTWITELKVNGGPYWNVSKDRNIDWSNPKPIIVFGSSTYVISFLITTTDAKLYKEPYFIILVIMKLLGYCIWLIIANLLRKVVLDFEKGELFNKANLKRLTRIDGLILVYYVFIHKFLGILTANLCRKIVFPEKKEWMIRPVEEYLGRSITENYMLILIIFTMLIFAIKKGMEIKEENDLTV